MWIMIKRKIVSVSDFDIYERIILANNMLYALNFFVRLSVIIVCEMRFFQKIKICIILIDFYA